MYKGCPKITENSLRMAKLPIVVCSQAAEHDLWSILWVWSKCYLVITFHCRVTQIFVKVVFVTPHKFELSKMDVKNEQGRAIKISCRLKKSVAVTVKLMQKMYTDEEWLWDSTLFKGRKTSPLLLHFGRPLSICTGEVVNIVIAVVWDHHITVR